VFNLKRIAGLVCLACLPALLGVVNLGTASAANETISIKTAVVPTHGKIFKRRSVPAKMQLSVEVHTPSTSPKANPLKRAVVQFPRDLSFNPNNRRTPVCSDKALSNQSNLSAGTAAAVAACPKSVIGTGTAKILLAKVNSPSALVTDPQLVIFNAGKDKRGQAKLKIYAFSAKTNVGILMHGTLSRKGVINVFVPVLSNDSATASFVLAIPGPGLKVGNKKVKGRDPNYARIRCSKGKWVTRGTFTLGERTFPAGTPTGPSTVVKAKPYTAKCHGARG
jgi:hypothetical protein